MEGFVLLTFQTLKFMPYFLVLDVMYDQCHTSNGSSFNCPVLPQVFNDGLNRPSCWDAKVKEHVHKSFAVRVLT